MNCWRWRCGRSLNRIAKPQAESPQLAQATVQYFTPSYSLYPVLAEIHGAANNAVPLKSGFQPAERCGAETRPAVGFQRRPHARHDAECAERSRLFDQGTGSALPAQRGVVVLDEAYVDFADENALPLALKHPHVLVARTFSKAYSLCFQRVGYFVGHPELIAALHKIRDSYNVNGLGQIAAEATLDDLAYYRANFRRIIATRERVESRTDQARLPRVAEPDEFHSRPASAVFRRKDWLQKLRDRKILVRWFSAPEVRDYLRITIGTPAEAEALVRAAKTILAG